MLALILIDEISMISAQLLAQIEILVGKVVRRRNPYRGRSDGSTRPFGGVNTLLFGDWWQLKPVTGTCLFSNPANAPSFTAWYGLMLLWGERPDAVHRCWDFVHSLRCDDLWYNHFLGECRRGALSAECYNMLHGYPTAAPAHVSDAMLKLPGIDAQDAEACTCVPLDLRSRVLRRDDEWYYEPWVRQFLDEGAAPQELLASECGACRAKRLRRCRVLPPGADAPNDSKQPPFDAAPALYAFNVPRYCAVMLRARDFATARGQRLHWCRLEISRSTGTTGTCRPRNWTRSAAIGC